VGAGAADALGRAADKSTLSGKVEVHGGRLAGKGTPSTIAAHVPDQPPPPIFIFGVPRSGTTLLRTLLDSHPAIACGPETPWLGGHQPRSVHDLVKFLAEDKHGYCASYGQPREAVVAAARRFVSDLMESYARAKGKRRWAEKTPDNVLYVDFLLELFPEAKVLWLVRGTLDVAASTSIIDEHRKGVSAFHEQKISFGPGLSAVPNTPFAAVLRSRHWNKLLGRALKGREHLKLSYESLVAEPRSVMDQVCRFVGEPFEESMLRYGEQGHDLPEWEWGSADIRTHTGITTARTGRAVRDLPAVDLELLKPLARPAPERPAPRAALATVGELDSEPFRRLMEWFNAMAGTWKLRTFTDWSKVWEYPWLWQNGLSRLKLDGARVFDLGSELSPMPWILALLGARVTLVETDKRFVPAWRKLRDGLRVRVDWAIVTDERIPAKDASADLVTSLSVLEHQPDKAGAIAEIARVLRPGGCLALSCDICEPSLGMSHPEWNGAALTLEQFASVWQAPGFGNTSPPDLDRSQIPSFLEWHRRSAPHHNYVVGAAVMLRR
jgi:protein-tyrosine sulfotransferase